MAKSSINFAKAKSTSEAETKREFDKEQNYLLPKELRKENLFWSCGKSDDEVFRDEISKRKNQTGKTPKAENSKWEAILNFNENHTMEDIKKVAEHIEKKFNIICTRIAMHSDEGHLVDIDTGKHLSPTEHYYNDNGKAYKIIKDENGKNIKTKEPLQGNYKAVYNYHAHLNFVTYKDCKQNWRQSLVRPKLRELQTEVAELLGMERGKIGSKTKHLHHSEHRERAIKEQEFKEEQEKKQVKIETLEKELEQEKATKKEIKEEFEKLRKSSIGQGFDKEFYKNLGDEKKLALENIKTKDELKKAIEDFKEKNQVEVNNGFLRRKTQEPDYKKLSNELEISVIEQAEIIDTLKNAIEYEKNNRQEVIKEELAEEREKLEDEKRAFVVTQINDYTYKKELQSLKEENQELKQENSRLKNIISKLWKFKDKVINKFNDLKAKFKEISHLKQKDEEIIKEDYKIDLKPFKREIGDLTLDEILFSDNEEREQVKEHRKVRKQ